MNGAPQPAPHLAGPGPEDPLIRRRRFEDAHPEITISPPQTHASMWTARRSGKIVANSYQLASLLDALDWLTGERT